MSVEISVDVGSLEDVAKRIDAFDRHRRADFAAMLSEVGKDLDDRARERVSDDKFDPDGQPWAPWSDSYAASGRGLSLLERSGRMRRSFRMKSSTRSVTLRNLAPYFKFHQGGTKRMPARPVLGWGPEELDIASKAATEALGRAFA